MRLIVLIGIVVVILAGYSHITSTDTGTSGEPNEEAATTTTDDVSAAADNVLTGEAVYTVGIEPVVYHDDTEGYLAVPEGDGPFPAVVLIHEWWGLNTNIQDLAEDFAEQGYVALAVDLYNGEVAETADQAGALAGAVRDDVEPAFANLESAVEYLKGLPYVDGDSLASVGWCFGGGWAYEMAANNMGIDASVMYYGRFSLEDDLSMMRADILGHFGEEDRSIAIDDVEQFEATLNTLDGDHAVFIYPNAGHAFANEDNEDAYNEAAAQLAWQRTMDFLTRQLQTQEREQ